MNGMMSSIPITVRENTHTASSTMLEFSSLAVLEELILVHPGKNLHLNQVSSLIPTEFAVILGE